VLRPSVYNRRGRFRDVAASYLLSLMQISRLTSVLRKVMETLVLPMMVTSIETDSPVWTMVYQ